MKSWLALALAVYSSATIADCFHRTQINTETRINAGPTDIQTQVTRIRQGWECVSTYRLHLGLEWQTVEGVAQHANQAEACRLSQQLKNGRLLQEVPPTGIRTSSDIVCTEGPTIRVRNVHVGEQIWESEADLHWQPKERGYWFYKKARCRKFQERWAKDGNMIVYNGIMCQAGVNSQKWMVVDKY